MKNIKNILLIVLFLLVLPITVKADMVMPGLRPYEVTVTNADGAKTNEGIFIPFGEVLKINGDYKDADGKMKGSTEYNGKYYEVYLDDVTINDKIYNPDRHTEFFNKRKMYVFSDKGLKLYTGPSLKYDEIESITIPEGTILEAGYGDEAWSYVEYKNVKGWLYTYQYSGYLSKYGETSGVAYVYDDEYSDSSNKIITIGEVKLIDNLDDKNEIATIPADTELEYNYSYYYNPNSNNYHVKYNGQEGWVTLGDVAISYKDVKLMIKKKLKAYEKINNEGKSVIIPKKTEVEELYAYYSDYDESESYIKILYKNKEYWITIEPDTLEKIRKTSEVLLREDKRIYETEEKVAVYDWYDFKNKIGSIEKGNVLFGKYIIYGDQACSYVEYNNIKGWVLLEDLKDVSTYSKYKETYKKYTEDDEKLTDGLKKDNKKDFVGFFKNLSKKEMIMYSIGGAVVLALVIIVIIKLINKKRKGKVVPIKTNVEEQSKIVTESNDTIEVQTEDVTPVNEETTVQEVEEPKDNNGE